MNEKTMEQQKFDAQIAELMANTAKLQAETMKLNKESAKLNKELKWYEVSVIIAVTLAIVAVAKLFL